jgi:hypothetical protein
MANFDDYLPSGTWDVIDAPSEEIEYIVDGTKRMELVYKFRIRRKTLFYTVNLIIPTVLISFLSIFVFYLPTDEGEKMTLCISILLALVVFLLLVSKILPPTSIVIPLIAKYLLFTLIMNIVTILNTVIIINWNYRTPRTHNMPRWVRIVFTDFLPKVLFTKRRINPDKKVDADSSSNIVISNNNICDRSRPSSTKSNNSAKLINSIDGNEYENINRCHNKKYASTAQSITSLAANNNHYQNDYEKKTSTFQKTHQKQQQHLNLNEQIIKKNRINNRNSLNRNLITATEDILLNSKVTNIDSNNSCKYNSLIKRQNRINIDKSDSDEVVEQKDEEYTQEMLDAADKVAYITNHIKSENDYQEVR